MNKARKKKRRRGRRKPPPVSSTLGLRRLRRVFSENSAAIMRLATEGATPAEIAERLEVKESDVAEFVEAFAELPCGMDSALLRSPSLLGKHKQVNSMLKNALRSPRSHRNR